MKDISVLTQELVEIKKQLPSNFTFVFLQNEIAFENGRVLDEKEFFKNYDETVAIVYGPNINQAAYIKYKQILSDINKCVRKAALERIMALSDVELEEKRNSDINEFKALLKNFEADDRKKKLKPTAATITYKQMIESDKSKPYLRDSYKMQYDYLYSSASTIYINTYNQPSIDAAQNAQVIDELRQEIEKLNNMTFEEYRQHIAGRIRLSEQELLEFKEEKMQTQIEEPKQTLTEVIPETQVMEPQVVNIPQVEQPTQIAAEPIPAITPTIEQAPVQMSEPQQMVQPIEPQMIEQPQGMVRLGGRVERLLEQQRLMQQQAAQQQTLQNQGVTQVGPDQAAGGRSI